MTGAETFRASAEGYDSHVGRYGAQLASAFCKALDEDRRAALYDAYRRRLPVGNRPLTLTARAWAVAGIVRH